MNTIKIDGSFSPLAGIQPDPKNSSGVQAHYHKNGDISVMDGAIVKMGGNAEERRDEQRATSKTREQERREREGASFSPRGRSFSPRGHAGTNANNVNGSLQKARHPANFEELLSDAIALTIKYVLFLCMLVVFVHVTV